MIMRLLATLIAWLKLLSVAWMQRSGIQEKQRPDDYSPPGFRYTPSGLHHSIAFILLSILAIPPVNAAETTDWQANRLVPLKKITAGPWDNFEATISNDDKLVYFTRDRNQIPNIYTQNLDTNTTDLFIGAEGDAKDPALDNSGRFLAFTYYKFDAQGDVCIMELANKNISCLTSTDTVDESPFWIDTNHLGYLSRDAADLNWSLISHDLKTKQAKVLYTGFISAPIASPDGRYILFNQTYPDGVVRLQAYDLQTSKMHKPPTFDLSGITGFTAFSKDGQYLYFNHYLNDTNFDQVIDGNDNSVAFRIPFQQWLTATQPLLPEQLTSVANNCKFPAVTQTYLYLTCAFEGSLDVYRLPLSGTVPPEWNEQQLGEAHLSARSYEDRLLILNTLRYRFHHNEIAMLERLLSNHLEIGELTASSYYVAQLEKHYQTTGDQQVATFYKTLGQLLLVRSSKQRVPVGVVTARFQSLVADARGKIHTYRGWSTLLTMMDGYLDYELENYDRALNKVEQVDLASAMLPLERYLAFDLYRRLLEEKDPHKLLTYYPLMFNETSLPLEAQIYYAFNYLKLLGRTQSDSAARIKTITEQAAQVKTPKVAEFFHSEIFSLKLAAANEPQQQGAAFKELTDLLKRNKDNLLVRKAMHTRAIQILGEAEQFQYMELLSRHWLVTTHISEMEFYNVAEQYSVITMDKAYGMMAEGALAKAYATFYSAIRQTNDLEAHYQFITLGLTPSLNKKDNLARSYEVLEKDNILGQNKNYADALKLLIETGDQGKNEKALNQALALLEPMRTQGLNPSMRDLLIGYIYHQKMRNSQKGYYYDKTYFQKAHYHYIIALDLARDNSRISATVWENLGWLHFDVRNYALSADFYHRRLQFPFVSPDDEARTRWAYARALFYNNNPETAEQQSQAALAIARNSKTLDYVPFLEKTAFYALQAGDYKQAKTDYEELLGARDKLSGYNQAKALLGYGYVLKQVTQPALARERFQELLALSKKLDTLPTSNTRLVAFKRQRLQLLAYGFLAELSDNPAQRAEYRTQRTQLLRNMAGNTTEFAYEESGRLSFLTKDLHHIAVDYEQAGDFAKMADTMDDALSSSIAWMDETGDEVGPVIYRTLINYLSLGLSHPDAFKNRKPDTLQKTCARVLKAFTQQPFRSAFVIEQNATLAVLWEAYQSKVLGVKTGTLAQRLQAIINAEDVQQLNTAAPQSYQDLQALVSYFK
jgi:Tol biopolymer transport system component